MKPGMVKTLDAIINAALRGELDETHARRLHELGPEAVALAMLAASNHIAEQKARLRVTIRGELWEVPGTTRPHGRR